MKPMITTATDNALEINGLSEIIAALGGALVAAFAAIGVWWRGRADRDTKRIDGKTAAHVAQIAGKTAAEVALIETTSSQELKMLDILLARVTKLEDHNTEQDKVINRLVEEKAAIAANLTVERERNVLLAEQNALLREEVRMLSIKLGDVEAS